MTDSLPPFSCTHTPGIPALLAELNCSLVISTYQAGKVILLSAYGGGLVQLPRNFNKPMGLAAAGLRLAVATRDELVILVNDPKLSPGYPPAPGKYDALFAPRAVYFCGELDLHDMAWHDDTLWAVNTRFSYLCRLDHHFSFTPHWRPPFISDLTDEDRCHLNGLALTDGEILYVTALGATDTPRGWRANKTKGGILMHVPVGKLCCVTCLCLTRLACLTANSICSTPLGGSWCRWIRPAAWPRLSSICPALCAVWLATGITCLWVCPNFVRADL